VTSRLPIWAASFCFERVNEGPNLGGWGGGDKVGAIGSATEQSHLDTIFVPRSRRVRDQGSLFPKQNHLPPKPTNATNFVLVLIGLSLPHRTPHPIKAKAPSNFWWGHFQFGAIRLPVLASRTFSSKAKLAPEMGPFLLPNQSTAASSGCRLSGDRDLSRAGRWAF
jgi:hypothetical protein